MRTLWEHSVHLQSVWEDEPDTNRAQTVPGPIIVSTEQVAWKPGIEAEGGGRGHCAASSYKVLQ